MAGATNPGNIGHAWVKALWVDHKPPAGFDQPGPLQPERLRFHSRQAEPTIRSTRTTRRIAARSKRCPSICVERFSTATGTFSPGQYFDIFDYGRHTVRPEEIRLEALVAALDFDRLGLSASQRGLLALRGTGTETRELENAKAVLESANSIFDYREARRPG